MVDPPELRRLAYRAVARTCGPIALAMFAALVIPRSAAAGPWVHAPGDGYVKTGLSLFRTQQGMRDGQSTGLEYQTTTWSLYAEVGLPGRLQITAYVPYVMATNASATTGIRYNNDAFGDITVALDHGLVPDFPFTIGVEVKVPAYTDPSAQNSADGLRDGLFDPSKFPVLGDDNIDVTPRVQIGHSLYPIPMWTQLELGWRWRSCRLHGSGCQDLRDSLVATATLGGWLWPERMMAELYTKAVVNVQPETDRTVPTEQSVYVQGKLTFADPALQGVGVTLGVGGLPYAHAAARGYDVSIGVSYRF